MQQALIEFSDEQQMLMESARQFCRDRSPVSAVRALLDSESGYDESVWREAVELGWPGIAIAEEHGGAGLDPGALVPVLEAMGRQLLALPLTSTVLAARLLQQAGGGGPAAALLPELAGGTVATVAVLDGSDWGQPLPAARAEPDGDGLRLSGTKRFVADLATARLVIATVLHDGAAALALLRRDALPEAAIRPLTLVDETRRAADLCLDGLRIDADDLVTGDGVRAALHDLGCVAALLSAAEDVGTTAATLDLTVDYLKTRKQFGRLIGGYQALKHPTVDVLTALEAARSQVYHAATRIGSGHVDRAAEIACRMAKAAASEALVYAADRAVQFHGGIGFTWDCDAQLYMRRAQDARGRWGDARHHRKRLAELLL